MVRKEVFVARLERLTEYVSILHSVLKYDLEKFLADPFIYGTAERNLHLTIECLLDIGNHIIADQGLEKPESYADILRILSERSIIPADLFQALEGMAAFRNVLVHDYVKLDRAKIYQVLGEKLPALESLAGCYAKLL